MSSPGLWFARCVWATLSQATQALARTTVPPLPSREGDKRVRPSTSRASIWRVFCYSTRLSCALLSVIIFRASSVRD
jgi:hypothetical protein